MTHTQYAYLADGNHPGVVHGVHVDDEPALRFVLLANGCAPYSVTALDAVDAGPDLVVWSHEELSLRCAEERAAFERACPGAQW